MANVPEGSSALRHDALRRWLALAVGAILALYGVYWGYRFLVSRLGALAPLVFAISALPVLAGIAAWSWHCYATIITHHATRVARWAWCNVEQADWYQTSRTRHPARYRFASDRVDPHGATGLGLSIVVVAAAAALWAFAEVLIEVVSGASITTVDHRVINLFQMLRTPAADRVMLGATYIGSGRGVAVIAGAAVLVAILLRRWRDAVMVVASLVAGTAFFSIIKLIIRRPRPPLYDARIVQSGFSFPSGHATMAAVFYATLAVILIHAVRSFWLRLLIVLCATVAVVWIGLSRVYLGVHYPSDVLAGWAGGVLWALLALVALRSWRARHTSTDDDAPLGERGIAVGWLRRATAVLVPIAAIAYLGAVWPSVPAPPVAHRPAPFTITDAQLLPVLRTRVSRYTVGLFGHRQEPINLIFIGSMAEVVHAFTAAGWVKADRLSGASLRKALLAVLTGRPDPTGPVTPSFLGEETESLAFSQPVGRTFAQRHHIRIWRTSYVLTSGMPVWLATASYDEGYAITAGSLLPVHQIAPDIDTERKYVVASVMHTSLVADTTGIQLVPPEMGTNAFGQPFFTYGRALVIRLRDLPATSTP